MPNRIVREGINDSDRMDILVRDAGWVADSLFRRLLNVADDYGRFDARITMVKAKCYPTLLDMVRDNDLQRWLAACEKARLIRIYTADNRTIGEILDFRQAIRAEKSRFPESPDGDATHMNSNCDADATQVRSQAESKAQSYAEAQSKTGKRAAVPLSISIPEPLNSPEFIAAWNDWQKHRKEIGHALKPTQSERQLKGFEAMGVSRAIAAIEHTITKGWQGIREPDEHGGSYGNSKRSKPANGEYATTLRVAGRKLGQGANG